MEWRKEKEPNVFYCVKNNKIEGIPLVKNKPSVFGNLDYKFKNELLSTMG